MKSLTIKCIVAVVDANGSRDLLHMNVVCLQSQIDAGLHYKAAENFAENQGFESFLAFDQNDRGGRIMLPIFDLSTPETIYLDKNGELITVGDTVDVPEPDSSDTHQHEFSGTVYKFRKANGNVIVVDQDGNHFEIEPYRLSLE